MSLAVSIHRQLPLVSPDAEAVRALNWVNRDRRVRKKLLGRRRQSLLLPRKGRGRAVR